VDVLLASFNGERFLDAQLESLARQEDVYVRVWVNDDGSVDETLTILLKWQEKGLIKGISKTQRVGSTRAFLNLLADHPDSEYVAFCDQDDIWDPKKLSIQISKVTNGIPSGVMSKRIYIDALGLVIGASKKPKKIPSFENAIVENVVPGNTVLINNLAISLINKHPNPAVKHYDSWIYLLLTYFGDIAYIDLPLVKYRIHEGNHVGLRKYGFGRFLDSAENYFIQARYLGKIVGANVCQDKNPLLEDLISICEKKAKTQKAFLIVKLPFVRQRRIDQIGMKIMFLALVISSRI
jgi:glycosyltransferase involved in cell wall biosynthesis